MTIGVYILRFPNTDKVYIGQSINLETRLTRHTCRVNNGTASKKLSKAYNDFGIPSLEVLTECTQEELDFEEAQTIEIFDAIDSGFNTSHNMVKCSLYGQSNPSSKYSNEQIIDAFEFLVDHPNMTAKDISQICGISPSMVGHISCGESHKWLKDIFPEKYTKLLELKNNRRSKPNIRTLGKP